MARGITKVYLLSTPLENDYKHTLYFNEIGDQTRYFQSCIVKEYEDFSYQRKDHIIRIPEHYDDLLGCNYVMYQNGDFTKWWYAFIVDMKYVDDGRTDITIETDVLQTWYFDYDVLPSFVEREHVKDDTRGLHTIPEGVEYGPYEMQGYDQDNNLKPSEYIVMGSTVLPSGEDSYEIDAGATYNGVYSGVKYYAYKPSGIGSLIQGMKNHNVDPVSLFMAPDFLIKGERESIVSGEIPQTKSDVNYTYTIKPWLKLGGQYVPRNNKLLCYPYNLLLVSNGNGSTAEYRYEWFLDKELCSFSVRGALTPGCSIRMVPAIYNGIQISNLEGLTLGKYPQCNWATDQFTNWLTQNGINVATGVATGVVATVTGAIAGGGVGALPGLAQIGSVVQQVSNAERVPPQFMGSSSSGDIINAAGYNTFTYYFMTIREEYAKVIDGFFDMFGYKVNMVKTPNKAHRSRYWYTKTIDVNIDGDIPNKDMQIIKNCYNNGVTFWRNAGEIQNYSLSNGIAIVE